MFDDFRFDFISFITGLITGFFVSFVLYRLRRRISSLRESAEAQAQTARASATRTASARYVLDLTRFCEQYHFGGQHASLSDIIIEPRFIPAIEPYDATGEEAPNVFRVVPLVHEFPAVYAPFNIETIGVEDLGAGERHLALLGLPGSGRSTALAAIALWALGKLEFPEVEDIVMQAIEEEESQLEEAERVKRQKTRQEIQERALDQIERAQAQAAERIATAAQEERTLINLQGLMPILVHFNDISWTGMEGRVDPAEPLVRGVQRHLRRITSLTVPRYIYNRLTSGQALVLLDGLDDVPADQRSAKLMWLQQFLEMYPDCFVIVTGHVNGYHPLTQLGLTPMYLRPWTDLNARHYAERWADIWPEAFKQGRQLAGPPEEKAIRQVSTNTRGLTPLDLTMRLLAAYHADAREQGRWGWYDAFVHRNFSMKAFTESPELIQPALAAIAEVASRNLQHGLLTQEQIIDIATKAFTTSPAEQPEPEAAEEDSKAKKRGASTAEKPETILDVDEFTRALLIQSGLLVERIENQFEFCHHLLASFAVSEKLIANESAFSHPGIATSDDWQQAIAFAAGKVSPNAVGQAVIQRLKQPADLLFDNLFGIVPWLADAPASAPWRGEIFKRLAAAIIAPAQYPILRERALAALVSTRDSGILFILRQALRSTDPNVRRLGCIGLGVLGEGEGIRDLRPMLQDENLDVQLATGLALGAIGSERALEVMVQGLLGGEENLRQAVAEAFAAIPGEGHKLLHEAIQMNNEEDDMFVRRAAVYGLARIGTPWALTDMYRALLEDQQWYVRSAAEQAFAEAQNPAHGAVLNHPPIESLGWLADWAAAKGEGIPSGDGATAMLIRVLQEGAPPDRIAAAYTLGLIGHIPALKPLYNALNDKQEPVREAAFKALADLQTRVGEPLPGVI